MSRTDTPGCLTIYGTIVRRRRNRSSRDSAMLATREDPGLTLSPGGDPSGALLLIRRLEGRLGPTDEGRHLQRLLRAEALRRIEVGPRATLVAETQFADHPVEAEGAVLPPVVITADEVPGALSVDESVGIEGPGLGAGAAPVVEGDRPALRHRFEGPGQARHRQAQVGAQPRQAGTLDLGRQLTGKLQEG